MGRSAKLRKRVPKKLKATTSSSSAPSTPSTTPNPSQSKAQTAKRRADLKAKAAKAKPSASASGQKEGHVLGGADYVSLLLGGRRKAREEAEKLPHDEDS